MLLATTDAVGGVWRYSVDLVHGLRARDIPCTLAVLGPTPSAAQRAECPGIRIVDTGLPLDWTAPNAATLATTAERLAALATQLGATSVHLHAPALVGEAAWHAPVVAVAHSCIGTWWRAMREGPPPADFAWRIAATAAGLHRADAVIAPTAAHAAAVQAVYGNRPIHIVHNGAEPTAHSSATRDRAVLTAGRLWDEAKGAALLDRIAPTLNAPIRAAGSLTGPNGAHIALRNLVTLGTLDRAAMAQAYASTTVFVSAAPYEPFGLSVLEAAQAGMRLVLWDTPGFRELWDGAATFARTEADLVTALHAALDETGPAPAAARAARYTVPAMVDATLAVHRQVSQ